MTTVCYFLSFLASTETSAKDVKSLVSLMVFMVIVFMVFLFWENELNEDIGIMTLQHLHMDYPKSNIPIRYCNSMILRRIIREPDHTCKKEHVFIHESFQHFNNVCSSPKQMICQNDTSSFCFQSEKRFKVTVCHHLAGTKYPACRYNTFPTEAFIIISCNVLGPVEFYKYVK